MTMTTEDVRNALLEAFDVDARLPKVKGPARLKAQNIGAITEEVDELEMTIAHAIAEARRGLEMSGEHEPSHKNIADVLRDKAPLPRGETKWTGATVARFLAEAFEIRVDPAKEEIAMMEERMAWLTKYVLPVDTRLVFSLRTWMVTECAGGSHRKAAVRLNLAIQTHLDRKDKALRAIRDGLAVDKFDFVRPIEKVS